MWSSTWYPPLPRSATTSGCATAPRENALGDVQRIWCLIAVRVRNLRPGGMAQQIPGGRPGGRGISLVAHPGDHRRHREKQQRRDCYQHGRRSTGRLSPARRPAAGPAGQVEVRPHARLRRNGVILRRFLDSHIRPGVGSAAGIHQHGPAWTVSEIIVNVVAFSVPKVTVCQQVPRFYLTRSVRCVMKLLVRFTQPAPAELLPSEPGHHRRKSDDKVPKLVRRDKPINERLDGSAGSSSRP